MTSRNQWASSVGNSAPLYSFGEQPAASQPIFSGPEHPFPSQQTTFVPVIEPVAPVFAPQADSVNTKMQQIASEAEAEENPLKFMCIFICASLFIFITVVSLVIYFDL